MDALCYLLIPLIAGWLLDMLLGDPARWPHPVIGFGKLISMGETRLNQGKNRMLKGTLWTFFCILSTGATTTLLLYTAFKLSPYCYLAFASGLVFFCLAGKTLRQEVRQVFDVTKQDLNAGRKQLSRIVGRDTSALDKNQIHTAALETGAENLSDGVIAPLFWYLIGGIPGMMTYKMINTLDSMIGYKNERYCLFGRCAARIDDFANYLPARITACLILLVGQSGAKFHIVRKYGPCHASPNSGYPEAALAAVLNCRFGGVATYFGKQEQKPYIGDQQKTLTESDMEQTIAINRKAEIAMILFIATLFCLAFLI